MRLSRSPLQSRWMTVALIGAGLGLGAACGDDGDGGGGPSGGPSDSVLALEPVLSGLEIPVVLTSPPGDPRLFIVEKNGRIRIYKNGALLGTSFLDITGLTTKGNEQGLLGLAFPPDYATTGRFYVSYTAPGASSGGNTVIARYHVSANADVADPASDTTVLTFAQPETNHNGGNIIFGPDGFLYLGFGDGGGDSETAQDGTDLLGSMLRIDVSGAGYTSPPSNPFIGNGAFRPELWNLGLRNPWRWSFDRMTGDLYIADVGQNTYEEVDVLPAGSGGENFGWPIMEGTHCFGSFNCSTTGLTLPVLTYDHGDGCAITGGYVYRGTAVPAVEGHYFYSDNCTGFIRSFRWSGGVVTDRKQWDDLDIGGVNSFGEDASGELYVMTYGGTLYRFAAPAP